jgi:hypothetical protein
MRLQVDELLTANRRLLKYARVAGSLSSNLDLALDFGKLSLLSHRMRIG